MPTRRLSPELLLAKMEAQNVSQRELSRRVGAATGHDALGSVRPALNRHLKGKVAATEETIRRYADALGVTVDEITVDDEEAESEIAEMRRRHAEELSDLRSRQTARKVAA